MGWSCWGGTACDVGVVRQQGRGAGRGAVGIGKGEGEGDGGW
jgi:hypothetical protein